MKMIVVSSDPEINDTKDSQAVVINISDTHSSGCIIDLKERLAEEKLE
jgi:hypothetical protein